MIREHELAELVEKQKADIAKLTARGQRLLDAIGRYVEADVSRALTAAGGPATLLMPHVMAEVRVVEEADGFRAVVVGRDGKTPRIKDGSGNAMSIEDLVAEFKTRTEYGGAFGAASDERSDGGKFSSAPHKINAADAKIPQKYVAAKDAATKAGVELEIVDTGGGGSGSGGGKGSNSYKISAADAKNPSKYVFAKEAAAKAGVELEIVA